MLRPATSILPETTLCSEQFQAVPDAFGRRRALSGAGRRETAPSRFKQLRAVLRLHDAALD
eukprot:14028440-Alexandrium_andersonii.AAC.1